MKVREYRVTSIHLSAPATILAASPSALERSLVELMCAGWPAGVRAIAEVARTTWRRGRWVSTALQVERIEAWEEAAVEDWPEND